MSCRRLARLTAAILALVLVAGACSSDPPTVVVSGDDPTTAAKNLAETLEAEGFTILAALVEEAGITDLFVDGEGDETYTVFAPTDAAFGELAPGLADLLAGEDDVVADPARSTEGSEVNTGQETGVEGDAADAEVPEELTDEGAGDGDAGEVVGGDEGDDGDTAAEEGQLPPGDDEELAGEDPLPDDSAEGSEQEDDEESAAPTASVPLAERPSRAEIRTLLADILSYHVVEGTVLSEDLLSMDSVTSLEGSDLEVGSREEPATTDDGEPTQVPTIQGADISGVDLRATNGVVHTIDSLLIPEDRADAIATLIASIPVTTDVISTLESTGQHTLLLADLRSSGLDATLLDADAVTLFAPTDDAYGKLSVEQRNVLRDDPDVLTAVLSYHAVARTITTADVQNQESVDSIEGQALLIVRTLIRPESEEDEDAEGDEAADEEATDDEATEDEAADEEESDERPPVPDEQYTVEGVIVEDSILTINGVIHVIGQVLVPDSAMGPNAL